MAAFDPCVAFTLLPANDGQPYHVTLGDAGGATAFGVTRATLSLWLGYTASVEDVRGLTRDDAEPIYRALYFDPLAGADLPAGVDLMVFDHGVLSGVGASARLLQNVVGVEADGQVGPITLAAVHARDPLALIGQLAIRQENYYRALADFVRFGRGWLARLQRRHDEAAVLAHEAAGQTQQV